MAMTPIVFVHGFSGGPRAWDRTGAALPRGARAAALTLPGHGPEPWLPAAGEASTFDDAVEAVAERWPAREPAVVVGYSMGARVALALALSRPSLFAHAVLIGVHPGLTDGSERAARAALDDARAEAILEGGVEAFADAWEREPLFASQRALPAAVRAAHGRLRRSHTSAGLAWAMRALGLGRMPPLGARAATLTAPVTLVTGERDAKFTALARTLANERGFAHRVVRGVGHDPSLEAPLELAAILGDILENAHATETRP